MSVMYNLITRSTIHHHSLSGLHRTPFEFSMSFWYLITYITQVEKPLQRHGGRLEKDEKYCGSCFGAEMVHFYSPCFNHFLTP